MRILTKLCFLSLALLLFYTAANAQFAGLVFTQTTGNTYSDITGGTQLTTNNDDGTWANQSIGFTFRFNSTDFTSFSVNQNNFIQLGTSVHTNYSSPLSGGSGTNVISINGSDTRIYSGYGYDAEIRYQTLGTSPNRVLVVQWKNWSPYGSTGITMNSQIRLYETTNVIEFHYGPSSFSGTNSRSYQVGFMGSNTSSYRNRRVTSGTNTWATSAEGTSISDVCNQTQDLYQANGLVYRWADVPMSYSASNVYQLTGKVARGSVNQPVIALEVTTVGSSAPISVSSITMNTNGTTRAGDIANARIYYTGSSGVFNTSNQFGVTVANPSGAFVVSGTQQLAPGNNYFWLTYDIVSNAVLGNYVDGECPSVTVSGTARTPTTTAPFGDRQIADPLAGTYTVGTGGDFVNLGAIFADLNSLGMKGSVTANIISDLNEGGGAFLNQWNEIGDGNYTLTIKPWGGARTLSSSGSSVLWFHGADRVTVDGRIDGTGRNLTLQNNLASGAGIIFTRSEIASIGGATNNTIRNCNIIAGSQTSTAAYGVFIGSTGNSISQPGEENDKITLQENQISRAYYGLYSYKGSSDKEMEGLLVKNNIFGSDLTTHYIHKNAIYMNALKEAKILGNTIYNMKTSPSWDVWGIYVLGANSGNLIDGNRIYGIHNVNTGGWAAWGIWISGGTGVTVANNFMWDFMGINYGGTWYQAYPIRVSGGSSLKFYNNSINLTGNLSTGSSAPTLAGIMFASAVTGTDMRNNIIRNTMTSTVSTGKSYSVYVPSGMTFQNIDYNVYDVSGANAVLGFYAGDKLTLPDWQASSTKDANSKTGGYSFISNDDLHLRSGWETLTAPPISTVTTDFDGENRRTQNSNIGADEVIPSLGVGTDLTRFTNVFCEGANADLTFVPAIVGYGDGIARTSPSNLLSATKYTWYKDNQVVTNPNSNTFSNGTSNVFTIRDMKADDAKTYRVDVDYFGAPTFSSRNSTLVMEFPINIAQHPTPAETCQDRGTHRLSVSATGTILGSGAYTSDAGYQWQKEDQNNPGNYYDIPGARFANYDVSLANPKSATGNYRVRVLGPGNCGVPMVTSNPAYLFVAEPLADVIADVNFADPMFICNGEDVIFNANHKGTGLAYQWQRSVDGAVYSNIETSRFPTARSQQLILPKSTIMETGYYRCIVTGHSTCNVVNIPTQGIEIKVWPFFEIAEHPFSDVVCMGEEVVLHVVPNGKVLEDQDGYQWQKNGINIDPKVNPTATSPILIINSANYDHSGSYRCLIHFEDCRGQLYTTTNEAQVYVLRTTEFVRQPESDMAELGETVIFGFDAHIYDYPPDFQPEIQWYRGNTPLVETERITGVKSSYLTIRDVQPSDFGDDYNVRLTGKCGNAQSDNFSLVQEATIEITGQPADVTICEGEDTYFQVVVNVIGSGATPQYHWYMNGNKLQDDATFSGTDTETLTINNAGVGQFGFYYCHIMVETAPGIEIEATSNFANLTLNTAPDFVMDLPATLTVEEGKDLRLDISAFGAEPMTYQWKKDGAEIAGETNPFLVIDPVSSADAGEYSCVVSNDCGDVESNVCNVTVQLQGATSVETPMAGGYMLLENAPNPFSNTTIISYVLPVSANVRLTLTDAQGREVATLVDKQVSAGKHDVELNANELNLTSGVYYYTLKANGFTATRRLAVVK